MSSPIEERIRSVRWEQYAGPEWYRPGELVEALIELASFDQSRARHALQNKVNKVLFAVGNDHAGTYYPAILEAADILIEIEQASEVPASRACARAVLNELYYFSAEVGTYNGHSAEQIESYVRGRLEPYADGA
jgi:hypothetical protein